MAALILIYCYTSMIFSLQVASSPTFIASLIRQLGQHFQMKDLGPLSYFLGIEVHHTSQGLLLSQTKYITDLLVKSNMLGWKPVGSPASKEKLSPSDGVPIANPTQFRRIVGALQYVTLTRPDICFAINQACQFMHAPTEVHFIAARRILRFLKGTITHGLHFGPGLFRL